ncbi:hypothetical protein [Flavivirga spongiicola]|uniref:Four helix bundle protein n=1 Tax=Flavivirga spongiicola TaxID=421621 RepID=A0ABU7XPU0_9FLAO|nr:hypothetical protein [Flavivirga sp. MEBiC05379]MDO5977799.1 hypothetical protein [Flavivirga sp. MEBiC05379]
MEDTAEKLIKDFIDWSNKYPRERIYSIDLKNKMEEELVKLEKRARALNL